MCNKWNDSVPYWGIVSNSARLTPLPLPHPPHQKSGSEPPNLCQQVTCCSAITCTCSCQCGSLLACLKSVTVVLGPHVWRGDRTNRVIVHWSASLFSRISGEPLYFFLRSLFNLIIVLVVTSITFTVLLWLHALFRDHAGSLLCWSVYVHFIVELLCLYCYVWGQHLLSQISQLLKRHCAILCGINLQLISTSYALSYARIRS